MLFMLKLNKNLANPYQQLTIYVGKDMEMNAPPTLVPLKTLIDRGASICPESLYLAGNTHIMPYIPQIASKAAHTPTREYIKIPKILIQIGYNVSNLLYSVEKISKYVVISDIMI